MKRLFIVLSLLTIGGWTHATVGPVAISSGSGFYNVDTSTITGGYVRQRVVIGDDSLTSGLAPVSSVTGLTVNLATSTSLAGQFILSQPNVLGATVTYNGTQQVNVGTLYQPSVIGATVTFNGTQNVQLQTGSNAIGSITNTSFAISTGGVTAVLSGALPAGTNALGSVTVSTGGVTAAQSGTWTVNVATGGVTVAGTVTANQGTAGSAGWRVDFSTGVQVNNSTVTIMSPNNNTTAIPITGSITSSSVNITTSAPNGAMPAAIQIIGGVNGSGLAQSFAVDTSSRIQIAGSITSSSVNITTSAPNGAMPAAIQIIGGVNASGLAQSFSVDTSSRQIVTISTGGVTAVLSGALPAGTNALGSVTVSTGGVSAAQVGTWTVNVATGGVTAVLSGALPAGTNALGSVTVSTGGITAAQSGTWTVNVATGGITATDTVLVTSNTVLPTSVADAAQAKMMGDNKGRVVTMPIVPWGNVLTATATLTTSTAETIFISSGGAGVANNLIGCIGENTSATAADITFRQSGAGAVNGGSFKLGMSVSNVPVGFFPPGGIPQSATNLNKHWTIQGSASVTSLHVTCWYYAYTP